MEIIQSIATKNPCYKAGRKITPKGLMLHSVGCPQPKASVFINIWNNANYSRACVHGVIDANDGKIYQVLPWNHRGWHAGGSGNNTHIGVEMCEPACIKYTGGSTFTCSDLPVARAAAKRTYNSAVQLFAYLCKLYGLNPLTSICSHKEGHKKGIASNHGDPEHFWKGLGLSYTMDTFRADVKKAMNGSTSTTNPSVVKPSTSGSASTSDNIVPSKVPFTVQILVSDLNYRAWPSMNSQVKGQTGKGSFTVDRTYGGEWGHLKSNAGWVYLKNSNYLRINSTTTTTSKPTVSAPVNKEYKVKVTASSLNVRSGPGTNYSKTKTIKDKGIYTITETKNNWGKLKSGAGWISLAYTQKM